jgi:hypothetical protein
MKKIVEREQNKAYYRVLHVPIWLWVFFILPGWPLTFAMYTSGFDRRHAVWFAIVFGLCAWRGFAGRLPGVELSPYVTHFGLDRSNLWYRVVCYTAAWIAIVVPFALNAIGLVVASLTGEWMIREMYRWLYYPLALLVVLATAMNITPRARRSTLNEGAERAWFYVGLWTVVPSQAAMWAVWRIGAKNGLIGAAHGLAGLATLALVGGTMFVLGFKGILPRTARYYFPENAVTSSEPARDSA